MMTMMIDRSRRRRKSGGTPTQRNEINVAMLSSNRRGGMGSGRHALHWAWRGFKEKTQFDGVPPYLLLVFYSFLWRNVVSHSHTFPVLPSLGRTEENSTSSKTGSRCAEGRKNVLGSIPFSNVATAMLPTFPMGDDLGHQGVLHQCSTTEGSRYLWPHGLDPYEYDLVIWDESTFQ